MIPERIVLGTRGSALALAQTKIVSNALRTQFPSLEIEVRVIQTHGDKNLRPIPLDTIGKGWFTGEIESALRSSEIDAAVHSLKDLAENEPEDLVIGAYLPREDARDVLITKRGEPLEELRAGAVVGTDSARRGAQMRALRADVIMQSLRGNVPTRIEKLYREPYDAIILAAAGLKRLGLENKITRYFSVQEMTPAPGQGILAVQVVKNKAPLLEALSMINDADAAGAAQIERTFSQKMGGGCKSPTGAYAYKDGPVWTLVGVVEREDGQGIFRQEISAEENSVHLGEELAEAMLKKLKSYALA